ncbi:MAG TPA: class I SAM-dependent methyltransferase [Verrucomicrobia bacterium]|nr:class I SAM-dependent methyltransferase [Verrucomicrobiota bacterium]HOB31492.1 class I SAM-dependent methyltransferase [Verrucomicrobiota bacterium]HOP98067.1 class I SAM-dependent methyltransferase [Verrucomicrobiota bacterium]HPU56237.1 class I SAM-dependent methyltransferase [Verrucomicrobiota bacterium]
MNRPRSDPDPAAALYQGASGRGYHEVKRELQPPALDWVMALRAAKFQPHVFPTDTVFEFGAGAGWNLARLRCARRIGCDAADFLADRVVALGIEFVRSPEAVPDGTADVGICHHVLEHVLDPAGALNQVARILKPGGRLIAHVPWERERRYGRYSTGEPNHHLYTWNAQTFGNLVALLGYRLEFVRVRRYGYDRFAATLAARLHAGEPGFRLLRACLILLRPLREIELLARKT